MKVSRATIRSERDAAQQLFEETFGGLAPDAVPSDLIDHPSNPIVAQAHDGAGGLIGAALTCRPALVRQWLGSLLMPAHMRDSMTRQIGWDLSCYEPVPDLVHELDLIAVKEGHRSAGVGEELVKFVEPLLKEMGVHALIGHTTPTMGGERPRGFYTKCGFEVLPNGKPLPKFLHRTYSVPRHLLGEHERPVFAFYKLLGPAPEGVPKPAVVPPKVKNQRREDARRRGR